MISSDMSCSPLLITWVSQVVGCHQVPEHLREDCIQEGLIAAWQAEQTYDARRGASLRTWVNQKVTYAVLDVMRSEDYMDKRDRAHARMIAAAEDALAARGYSSPTIQQVATEAGLTVTQIHKVRSWWRPAYDATEQAYSVADPTVDVEAHAVAQVMAVRVLSEVSAEERDILVRRFADDEPAHQIAASHRVSPSRLSQITGSATKRLRRRFGSR